MAIDLRGRSFVKEVDFTKEEFTSLIDLAAQLREEKRNGAEVQRLVGRNIALIFEKTSTRTRSAFEVGAHDQGAHVTYLGPGESQIGEKESMKDTARVLGRMFDGIEYRGFAQENVEMLATLRRRAGLERAHRQVAPDPDARRRADDAGPRNEAASKRSPTATSVMPGTTRRTHCSSPARSSVPMCASPLPKRCWPSAEVRGIAERLAATSGARLTVTTDMDAAVDGVDFLYTDVWLSMGEPEEEWASASRCSSPTR